MRRLPKKGLQRLVSDGVVVVIERGNCRIRYECGDMKHGYEIGFHKGMIVSK